MYNAWQVNISKAADVPRPQVPQATDGHGWTTTDDKLQYMCFQWPLIYASVAVEDDSLPSDDDITSFVIETEQDDVASDENRESGSDSFDDLSCIVSGAPCLETIYYPMNFAIIYVR